MEIILFAFSALILSVIICLVMDKIFRSKRIEEANKLIKNNPYISNEDFLKECQIAGAKNEKISLEIRSVIASSFELKEENLNFDTKIEQILAASWQGLGDGPVDVLVELEQKYDIDLPDNLFKNSVRLVDLILIVEDAVRNQATEIR